MTALLYAHYPSLMPLPDGLDKPPLSGTPTQIAKAILAYELAGVDHIMVHVLTYKPAAIRKLEQALQLYHQLSEVQGLKTHPDRN
jgi:alkanesulfonate monooxygenase SsuD/methylene tetrahydromethanopterin reductase-like flavin-dependent oxidoreductase (luciferase family)